VRRLAALILLSLPSGAIAETTFDHTHLRVEPATGAQSTVFRVGFTNPERTGVQGGIERHDLLTASVSGAHDGCIESIDLRTPDGAAGARIHLSLRPARLGGRWCEGIYRGQIDEIQTAVCPHGELCPTYALLRGTVGHLSFRVKPS